ncbi:MAG: hypothetical protein IJ733_19685 [Lachnospiraceae bacterium]|nr:hypothetical protein [Lachnospiraceae bacterium]
MKMRKKIALALGLACLVTGCGLDQHTEVSITEHKIDSTTKVYMTALEKVQFDLLTKSYNLSELGIDDLTFVDETRDGKNYKVLAREYSLSGDEIPPSMVLDEDKFVVYSNFNNDSTLPDSAMSSPVGSLLNQDPEFVNAVFTFDKNVLDTNGTLTGENEIAFSAADDLEKNMIYACFSEKSAKCKSIASDASRYTKKSRVNFITDGIVTNIKVDGADYVPYVYYEYPSGEKPVLYSNYYDFEKEKTCQFTVSLSSGFRKRFTFTYDKTAPKITYQKKKITVTDKNGVKKITLNGKKITSGKKVTKKGSYTVKAWDKAGNVKTYKFKVK